MEDFPRGIRFYFLLCGLFCKEARYTHESQLCIIVIGGAGQANE